MLPLGFNPFSFHHTVAGFQPPCFGFQPFNGQASISCFTLSLVQVVLAKFSLQCSFILIIFFLVVHLLVIVSPICSVPALLHVLGNGAGLQQNEVDNSAILDLKVVAEQGREGTRRILLSAPPLVLPLTRGASYLCDMVPLCRKKIDTQKVAESTRNLHFPRC